MVKDRPRISSPLRLTPAFQLFKPSKDLVLKHIWIFGPLYAVFVFFSIHSWLWSPTGPGVKHHWWQSTGVSIPWGPDPVSIDYAFVGFTVFWFLFTIIVGTIVQIMSQKAQLEAAEGKNPAFDKLWGTVKEMWLKMIGLYIVVTAVIIIGFFLIIIPGIFMVKRYFMSTYVMLDHKNLSIRQAMDKSAAMSPSTDAIWGVVLVGILFGIISVIPVVGWLIGGVLSIIYSVD